MAVSYEVYVEARRLPDSRWLESAIRGMEPSFAFGGAYDFAADSGWCPCRLGKVDCGFEWELEPLQPAREVSGDLAASGFDHVAQLSFRSSGADAICAVLVAANLAMIAGGTVVTPNDERVLADDALTWASAQIRQLKKGPKASTSRRKKAQDKRTPVDLLRDWLTELAAATVDGVIRSTPDDPLVAIKFSRGKQGSRGSQGAILKARSWTVSSAEGHESQQLSTAAMPCDMTPAEISELDQAFERLVTILRSGPLTSATYESSGFELQFVFPGGALVVHPLRQSNAAVQQSRDEVREAALAWTDRWEFQYEGQRIYADMDERTLVAGPF